MRTTKSNGIAALVRLKALELSGMDYKEAENILRWAYEGLPSAEEIWLSKAELKKNDVEFVKRTYLKRQQRISPRTYKKLSKYIIEKDACLNQTEFKRAIKEMHYADFLETRYWRIITKIVREKAGNRCEICGSSKRLDVHHKTYGHHGEEHLYMDDLMCVCRDCHTKITKRIGYDDIHTTL